MKSIIESAIPKTAINEIVGECLAQDIIQEAYSQFRKKSRKYLSHDEHENVVSLMYMFKNYLKTICENYIERFKENQSEILTCSKELIRDGLVFPIFTEKMIKTLSEILHDLHNDNCINFHRNVDSLMRKLEKCEDKTEHISMKTLLEFVPKDGCLESDIEIPEHDDLMVQDEPQQKGNF